MAEISTELKQELYNHVKTSLYDPVFGLRIRYTQENLNKAEDEARNMEVYEYMMSDPEHERAIIDKIIDLGVRLAISYQNTLTAENIESFLTLSSVNHFARDAYQEIMAVEKAKEETENMQL